MTDLPIELVEQIILQVISISSIPAALHLRRVNRHFSALVIRHLARHRASSCALFRNGRLLGLPLEVLVQLAQQAFVEPPWTNAPLGSRLKATVGAVARYIHNRTPHLHLQDALVATIRCAMHVLLPHRVLEALFEPGRTMHEVNVAEVDVRRGAKIVAIEAGIEEILQRDESDDEMFQTNCFGTPLAASARAGNLERYKRFAACAFERGADRGPGGDAQPPRRGEMNSDKLIEQALWDAACHGQTNIVLYHLQHFHPGGSAERSNGPRGGGPNFLHGYSARMALGGPLYGGKQDQAWAGGHAEVARAIMEALPVPVLGNNISEPTALSPSMLQFILNAACVRGLDEFVMYLYSRGWLVRGWRSVFETSAAPNADSALATTAAHGRLVTLKVLLNIADLDQHGSQDALETIPLVKRYHGFQEAARHGQLATLDLLYTRNLTPRPENEEDQSYIRNSLVLGDAVRRGDESVLRWLGHHVFNFTDVDDRRALALAQAAHANSLTAVRVLVCELGASPNGLVDVPAFLSQDGEDADGDSYYRISAEEQRPLLVALQAGHAAMVRELHRLGADRIRPEDEQWIVDVVRGTWQPPEEAFTPAFVGGAELDRQRARLWTAMRMRKELFEAFTVYRGLYDGDEEALQLVEDPYQDLLNGPRG